MRQVQTLQKVWLWGIPMLMLCATAACSDSDNNGDDPEAPDPTDVVELATSPITVTNDQAALASRVRNFSAATSGTRAAESITAVGMPEQPTPETMPADTISWTEQVIVAHNAFDENGNYVGWVGDVIQGHNCVLAKGDTFTDTQASCSGWAFMDGNYYIRGEATLDFHNCSVSEGANIYVLTGGKLTLKGSIPYGVHVYVYGEIDVKSVGQIVNTYWQNQDKAGLYCLNDLDLGTEIEHSMTGGTIYVGGALTGNLNNLNSGGWVVMDCGSHITSQLNVNSYSAVAFRGSTTIDGPLVLSSGYEEVYVSAGSLLKGSEMQLNDNTVAVRVVGDGYAYLQFETITSNGDDFTSKLDGYFAISCPKFVYGTAEMDASSFKFVAQVLLNDAIEQNQLSIPTKCPGSSSSDNTTTEPETPSNPDPTPDPEPDPDPTPEPEKTVDITVLETVSDITPDTTHTHPISATGIDVANGKIYVSWHWRGVNYHGCVEIGEMTATGCQLDQFFETPASEAKQKVEDESLYGKDFNHIMVDPTDNRIYVVGNEAKGGFLAYVDLNSSGLVGNGGTLTYRRLLGGDGNCIIRNGDYLQVASTYGYESYVLPALDRKGRSPQPGKSKFITKVNGNVYGMHFNSDSYTDANMVSADKTTKLEKVGITIDRFDGTDYLFENSPVALSSTYEVSPVDGKNVVKVDTNGDIYVCRGAYGITRLSDGATYQLPMLEGNQPRGYANGCDVDDKYVYVSYGSAGIHVLNKSDLSLVAKYTYVGGNSANYVKVPGDGYIYVAYGENGWQVYRLVTKTVTVAQ